MKEKAGRRTYRWVRVGPKNTKDNSFESRENKGLQSSGTSDCPFSGLPGPVCKCEIGPVILHVHSCQKQKCSGLIVPTQNDFLLFPSYVKVNDELENVRLRKVCAKFLPCQSESSKCSSERSVRGNACCSTKWINWHHWILVCNWKLVSFHPLQLSNFWRPRLSVLWSTKKTEPFFAIR